jgi:hypothetical protein
LKKIEQGINNLQERMGILEIKYAVINPNIQEQVGTLEIVNGQTTQSINNLLIRVGKLEISNGNSNDYSNQNED